MFLYSVATHPSQCVLVHTLELELYDMMCRTGTCVLILLFLPLIYLLDCRLPPQQARPTTSNTYMNSEHILIDS